MALWGSTHFQNFVWVVSSYLESLHDLVMVWLVVVLLLVTFISLKVFIGLKGNLLPDSQTLEVTWTLIPIFILLSIAYPSIYLLCLQDSSNLSPVNSVKVISNQWNWQSECKEDSIDHLMDYELVDLVCNFDSPFLIKSSEGTRILTVSTDVLHSLGIPSMGVKLDAAPGRISMTVLEVLPGNYLGSCYELCGSGHSAMPIHFVSI